jgi:hypothetical protein
MLYVSGYAIRMKNASSLNANSGEMVGASISVKQKGEGESMRNNLHCTDALPAFIIS